MFYLNVGLIATSNVSHTMNILIILTVISEHLEFFLECNISTTLSNINRVCEMDANK